MESRNVLTRAVDAAAQAHKACSAGKALAFFEKTCDDGGAIGCNLLAVMYKRGEGVTPDRVKAAHLNQKACDLRFRNRCKK